MKTQNHYLLALATTLFTTLLSFQVVASTDLATQLQTCQNINNDQDRLACYDNIQQTTEQQQAADEAPQKPNEFPALIADLNEPNVFVSYGQLDFLGDDFRAVLLGGGLRQKVRDFTFDSGRSVTFNVFGQIRSQFDVSEIDTRNNRGGALINTDFTVGGELVQSLDHWNWRLSYAHRSTHLGDEFIIDNQNFLTERLNLSYETLKWTAHKAIKDWDLYAGVGFITRAEPSDLDKSMWQLGWQYQGELWHGLKPVWAVDLHSWGAYDWNINVNMRAGFEISQFSEKPFQLLFEYQDGHSPYGQFFTEDLTFTGITFLQNW